APLRGREEPRRREERGEHARLDSRPLRELAPARGPRRPRRPDGGAAQRGRREEPGGRRLQGREAGSGAAAHVSSVQSAARKSPKAAQVAKARIQFSVK